MPQNANEGYSRAWYDYVRGIAWALQVKAGATVTTWIDAITSTAAGLINFPNGAGGPTPAAGDSSTLFATTAFVQALVSSRKPLADLSYTALATDRTIAFNSITAPRTITLPAANTYPVNVPLTIMDESGACNSANYIAVVAAGSDKINGGTTTVVGTPFGRVLLYSNGGTKWTIVAKSLILAATPADTGSTNNSSSGSGSFVDHTPTVTIPANTLQTNKLYRLTVTYKLTTGSAAPTLGSRLKAGSTVIHSVANVQAVANLTNANYSIQYIIQGTAAAGASANVEVSGVANINASTATTTCNNISTPVALATNADLVLTVGTNFGSAGTGTNTITPAMLLLEELN